MKEEENGRYYYDYKKGAQYEIHDHHSGAKTITTVTVNDMFVSKSGEEVYLLFYDRGAENGVLGEWTKSQFEIYLEMSCASIVEEGEQKEYPLIASDVKYYFAARKRARRVALQKAEKILVGVLEKDAKGNPKKDKNGKVTYEGGVDEYRFLLKEKEELEAILAKRYARGLYAANQESMYRRNCERRIEIIKEHGVPVRLFYAEKICPDCNNKGITDKGQICSCAYPLEEEIKTFCAGERLKKKLAENWANGFSDGEDVCEDFEDYDE